MRADSRNGSKIPTFILPRLKNLRIRTRLLKARFFLRLLVAHAQFLTNKEEQRETVGNDAV